jgi:hypothetical protein
MLGPAAVRLCGLPVPRTMGSQRAWPARRLESLRCSETAAGASWLPRHTADVLPCLRRGGWLGSGDRAPAGSTRSLCSGCQRTLFAARQPGSQLSGVQRSEKLGGVEPPASSGRQDRRGTRARDHRPLPVDRRSAQPAGNPQRGSRVRGVSGDEGPSVRQQPMG